MFSNFLNSLSKQKLSVAIQKAHQIMLVAVVAEIILGISLSPKIIVSHSVLMIHFGAHYHHL